VRADIGFGAQSLVAHLRLGARRHRRRRDRIGGERGDGRGDGVRIVLGDVAHRVGREISLVSAHCGNNRWHAEQRRFLQRGGARNVKVMLQRHHDEIGLTIQSEQFVGAGHTIDGDMVEPVRQFGIRLGRDDAELPLGVLAHRLHQAAPVTMRVVADADDPVRATAHARGAGRLAMVGADAESHQLAALVGEQPARGGKV
jgi:hypothetical protein